MRNFCKLVFVTAAFLWSVGAQAGIHFEPYLGFGVSGDFENSSLKGSLSRTNFGFKLGYQAPMGFQLGIDLQFGTGSLDYDGSTVSVNHANADFGAYLGYQF